MTNQTVASFSTQSSDADDLALTTAERNVLRRLAGQVAELAARPIEQAKRELWYRLNALEATRPLVFCDPENGWNEIITPDQLACTGTQARRWEMTLRKEIYWGAEMQDDRVIEPCFSVPHVYAETDYGMHETRIGGEDGGSYVWEAPLQDYADLPKLHYSSIQVDHAGSARVLGVVHDIFGDLLQVRLKTGWWWSLGMTSTLINLRGLEQMMLDMLDRPDDLHRLMAFLRDAQLDRLDYLERNGLLSLNNDGTYVGSGGFGWSRQLPAEGYAGRVRTQDMWGFSESQETVGVSPRMFAEFILPYQLPLLDSFGLNCYGCCEPLDTRWQHVQRVPRLRRVSVSPWSSIPGMAERLGDRYIMSIKPRPSDLALPSFDEEMIRAGLRETLSTTRDCRVEVIMKDNHTLGGDPGRARRWVQIAKSEAESL